MHAEQFRNAHHKYVADNDVTSYLMLGLWRVTAHVALQCEPKQESTGLIEPSSVRIDYPEY